jgi:phosphoenolpyruvate-protein phosphotransferase (PTS system enzyme I)
MNRVWRRLNRITLQNPSALSLLLALVTLAVDFATGRDIRFPLLYLLPIGLAAWMDKKVLAYTLSLFLPVLRISFEIVWQVPELFPVEALNAAIEVITLSFFAYLIGRKSGETRQMEKAMTTKEEQIQYLRTFARLVGTTMQGRGISPGLADGIAWIYRTESESIQEERNIAPAEVGSELGRLEQALGVSVRELQEIRDQWERRKANGELALIEIRLAMIQDPSFQKNCRRRVGDNLIKAEQAVRAEVQEMERRLNDSKQEYLRERSADFRDLGHQVLRHLRTSEADTPNPLTVLPPRTILVAEELLLSDALQIDPDNLAAIVTEKTGPASHVAILARGRNIPAVCDIEDATALLTSGDRLLVDAEMGTVTVAPSETQAQHFATRQRQSALSATAEGGKLAQPCATKDGLEIRLHANIARPDEASLVREYRLDGIGLFRSEFLFLDADRPPDLAVQTAAYSEVANLLAPRPVIIRTMDLGGDKRPRFDGTAIDVAFRAGLRGLAYSLAEKTMFRTQLLAILRAAQRGNVKIMFPMVLGVADLLEAVRVVDDLLQTEPLGQRPPIGAMIETPAAVFTIESILQAADFISIGTNDLAHSILAIDRESAGSPGILSFLHPAMLRATEQTVRSALQEGMTVSVCGEAASDPAAACVLVGMGVRDLSMNPFQTAGVRQALRKVTIVQANTLAQEALAADSSQEIQAIISTARDGLLGS